MNLIERTWQQLDPVGTFSVRFVTVVSALISFIVVALTVSVMFDQLSNPSLALLALVVIGGVCLLVARGTDPYRGPFTRQMYGWVVALEVAAAALLAASSWQAPHFLTLGWVVPISLGLLSLALLSFRPARELMAFGALGAVVIAFITMLQAIQAEPVPGAKEFFVPAIAIIGVVILPLLALTFSAATFSVTMLNCIQRWQRRAGQEENNVSEERQHSILRSVQQDRVMILNREVVPFFAEVLQADTVTDADRDRAHAIADSIRRVMVAEVDRTWLENLIDTLRSRVRHDGEDPSTSRLVFDDDHVANFMKYDQRTGLRAFLVAIYDQNNNRPEDLEIVLGRIDGHCHGVIAVQLDLVDSAVKVRFGPYLAVMRVVFRKLEVEYRQSVLTVRFAYEQR